MGRGLSERKRQKNFLRAKQAKKGTLPLPPAPEDLIRTGRNKRKRESDVFSDAPRSFQKMMRLKEVTENGGRKKQKTLQDIPPTPLPVLSSGAPISGFMGSPGAPSGRELQPKRTAKEPVGQDTLFPKKTMKERKKNYLKEKKQKKKGKGKKSMDEEDEQDKEAEERERRIMTDQKQPAFGEQAQQPIKVNLKRKHWKAASDSEPKNRLQQVFKRQMAQAEQRSRNAAIPEAQQKYLVDAYRELKSSGSKKEGFSATTSSLAALVQRNQEMELARPS